MQRLMDAWADGLNYFLATHPNVQPRALRRFEPWMALSFTEGSIGGDIERIDLEALGPSTHRLRPRDRRDADPVRCAARHEPRGSNGIAIAPALTADGHALLLINPHTSFFFRSELQVTSDEGLNAYGAATWGQFFIYQGFNAACGLDAHLERRRFVDEFAETVGGSGKGFATLRQHLPPARRAAGHHPLPLRQRPPGDAQLHHLPHPSRPDRPLRERPLDRLRDDEPAGRGAAAELPADQGDATCSPSWRSRS